MNKLLLIIGLIFFGCSLFIPKKIKQFNNPYSLLQEYKKITKYTIDVDNNISTFYNNTYYKGKILSQISPITNKTILTAGFSIKILEFQVDSSSITITTNIPTKKNIKYNFKNHIYGVKLNKNIIDNILLNVPIVFDDSTIKTTQLKNNELITNYNDYNINYFFDKKITRVDSILIINKQKSVNIKLWYPQYSIWNNLYLPTKTIIYIKIKNKQNKIILNLIKRSKKKLDS